MGEAKPSQHAGFVEICVAECKPEFMARSSQLYYFMVRLCKISWALKVLRPRSTSQCLFSDQTPFLCSSLPS